MYTMSQINQMSKETFIQTIGAVFEKSPWISERAWYYTPFQSAGHMQEMLIEEMYEASREDQLDLLRSHPDLGTRLAMTDSSQSEQQGAGLNMLTEEEYRQLTRMNQRYTETFGFPFIMAVKGKSKKEIIEQMAIRVEREEKTEFNAALDEVANIAAFRLADLTDVPEYSTNEREG